MRSVARKMDIEEKVGLREAGGNHRLVLRKRKTSGGDKAIIGDYGYCSCAGCRTEIA